METSIWESNSIPSPSVVCGPTCFRPAFTLIELLLVLAVLATLSTLVMPRIGRLLAKAEHRATASGLQATFAQLRLKSIQTGQTHAFRYLSGSGVFELRAVKEDQVQQIEFDIEGASAGGMLDESLQQPLQDDVENGSPRLADGAGIDTFSSPWEGTESLSQGANSETDLTEQRQLENGMILVSRRELIGEEMDERGEFSSEGISGPGSGQALVGRGVQSEALSGDLQFAGSDATSWSAPVLFYPDGRASDARLFVVDPTNYAVELTVEGISGKTDVGQRIRLGGNREEHSLEN